MSARSMFYCAESKAYVCVYEKSVSVNGQFLYLQERPTHNFLNSLSSIIDKAFLDGKASALNSDHKSLDEGTSFVMVRGSKKAPKETDELCEIKSRVERFDLK